MERRTFLRSLFAGATGVAAAAVLLDPERLLWTPGERAHFLPPAGGWCGPRGVDWGEGDSYPSAFFHNESPSWYGNESAGGPYFRPGDVITIGSDPTRLTVMSVDGEIVTLAYTWPPVRRATDSVTGISMRFHTEFDPPRLDVLYGHRALAPDFDVQARQGAKALADRIDQHIVDLYKSSLDKAMRMPG